MIQAKHVMRVAAFTVFFAATYASDVLAQSVSSPAKYDLSPPLRSIPIPPKGRAAFLTEHLVKKIPFPPQTRAFRGVGAIQRQASRPLQIAPFTPIPGVGRENFAITSDPPDTNGSVSNTHYVQWVNTGFAVFDKATGARVFGPIDGNLLWTGFGGNCEHFNDGDPIVLYDKLANRWVLTQFAISQPPFSQCVAVSSSPDPMGTYARYEYQFNDFNDYPKFGVWPDGYYATFNMFNGNTFVGAKACAFERQQMLNGQAARMQCFDAAGQGGLLPSDLDGTTLPPTGTPNYVVNFGADQLNLWKFHVDWTNPANSSFSAPAALPTAPFEPACRNAGGQCVIQPSGGAKLDTLSDRMMYRFAYRRFTDHESMLVSHTVAAGATTGIRWYEIRDVSGNPVIYQQGTYAPDASFRWMSSMAMDKMGNVLMGYSVSSATRSPGIMISGRGANDPLNEMDAETPAVPGAGFQSNPDRWGDYASMSVDPSDDCTFWFSTQYVSATGAFNWSTSIVPVRFKNCQ